MIQAVGMLFSKVGSWAETDGDERVRAGARGPRYRGVRRRDERVSRGRMERACRGCVGMEA